MMMVNHPPLSDSEKRMSDVLLEMRGIKKTRSPHDQFTSAWKENPGQFSVDRTAALRIMKSEVVPRKHYRVAILIYLWLARLIILAAILLAVLFFPACLLLAFMAVPVYSGLKTSAQKFVVKFALESPEFYSAARVANVISPTQQTEKPGICPPPLPPQAASKDSRVVNGLGRLLLTVSVQLAPSGDSVVVFTPDTHDPDLLVRLILCDGITIRWLLTDDESKDETYLYFQMLTEAIEVYTSSSITDLLSETDIGREVFNPIAERSQAAARGGEIYTASFYESTYGSAFVNIDLPTRLMPLNLPWHFVILLQEVRNRLTQRQRRYAQTALIALRDLACSSRASADDSARGLSELTATANESATPARWVADAASSVREGVAHALCDWIKNETDSPGNLRRILAEITDQPFRSDDSFSSQVYERMTDKGLPEDDVVRLSEQIVEECTEIIGREMHRQMLQVISRAGVRPTAVERQTAESIITGLRTHLIDESDFLVAFAQACAVPTIGGEPQSRGKPERPPSGRQDWTFGAAMNVPSGEREPVPVTDAEHRLARIRAQGRLVYELHQLEQIKTEEGKIKAIRAINSRYLSQPFGFGRTFEEQLKERLIDLGWPEEDIAQMAREISDAYGEIVQNAMKERLHDDLQKAQRELGEEEERAIECILAAARVSRLSDDDVTGAFAKQYGWKTIGPREQAKIEELGLDIEESIALTKNTSGELVRDAQDRLRQYVFGLMPTDIQDAGVPLRRPLS